MSKRNLIVIAALIGLPFAASAQELTARNVLQEHVEFSDSGSGPVDFTWTPPIARAARNVLQEHIEHSDSGSGPVEATWTPPLKQAARNVLQEHLEHSDSGTLPAITG